MAYKVTCVTTDDESDYDDCRCISKIGYKVGSMRRMKTPQEVHDKIKNGSEFYVLHSGSRTYLEAVGGGPDRYVRTESNDTSADNLLKQPSC